MADRKTDYDILIIGGGINGTGIARDAAGRGFSVCLAEMNDLASGTSSWSTKLIHGGLRYLEHYKFRLVREALMEREVLWKMAPHIIWPLRFVLPHHKGLRPAWLLRLGLFVYDHLGGRKLLPPTRTINFKSDETGAPLKPCFSKGFEYSDCWVQDARLVVLNAMDAVAHGADVCTRSRVSSARRDDGIWHASLTNKDTGETRAVTARLIVNAAGPWVDNVLNQTVGHNNVKNVRLVQGSHIVVPKLYEHDRCYIFQNPDGRIIFTIPYEMDFTLIGTTDRDWTGDPGEVKITSEETEYLCSAASEYFKADIRPEGIVWAYSGVRSLFDDGATKAQEATRDYILREDVVDDAALINIFGGKITTYRKLAESMIEVIEKHLGKRGQPWTGTKPLPGGDFVVMGQNELADDLRASRPFITQAHARRLVRAYGTRARQILTGVVEKADLGRCFGADLYECEVAYLMSAEWAATAEDVLWRRSKLGLVVTDNEATILDDWMREKRADAQIAAQ